MSVPVVNGMHGRILPSKLYSPRAGIAGHIGVGHVYSHSGFMQDDSVGFASVLTLLGRAHTFDFTIADVMVEGNTVMVTTAQGGCGNHAGCGVGHAARGFSPIEEELVQRIIGRQCLAPQTLATYAFGRIYGQGISEAATALSLAIANAFMDTVRKNWPYETLYAPENIEGCCGSFLGGCLDFDGQCIAWLLSINASEDGVGPTEDAEGTIPIGNKGKLMQALGIDFVPTLVLESKAFVPALKDAIQEPTFYARWNNGCDNPVVGRCIQRALEESDLPYMVQDTAYTRDASLREETQRIGNYIAELGQSYANASTSSQKVAIAAELARLVSQDIGGSIFMSDAIFALAGGGGLWPGHGAVLSLLTPQSQAQELISMTVTDAELASMTDLSLATLYYILMHHEQAMAYVQTRRPDVSPDELLQRVKNA